MNLNEKEKAATDRVVDTNVTQDISGVGLSEELPTELPAELKKQIQSLEAQVKEKENKYVYLYAEFENFKRRSVKERSDLIKFGWESVARDFLQSVDHLELALQHVPSTTDAALMQGLRMVLNEIKTTMQKQGVQPIESLKKAFDPNFHEALGQEPSDCPVGTVIREHSRGYTLHGRLLRPARVVTSSGPLTNGVAS